MNSKWMVAAALAVVLSACGGTDSDPGVNSDAALSGSNQFDEKADTNTDTDEADGEVAADSADEVDLADDADNGNVNDADPADDADDADAATDADGSNDAPNDTDAACQADECGPGFGAPNVICDDGSIGGPVCERDDAGVCGWSIRECPVKECTYEECGPGPRPPIVQCSDGSTGGPLCERDDTGVCGWYIRECPAECPPEKCGDQPDWLTMCSDGTELKPVCVPTEDAATGSTCNWQLPQCR